MAFQTTNTQPVTNAPVTLTFSGLIVLKPGEENNTCEIGVHQFTHDHLFQVMLIANRPGRPPSVTRLLTGPLMTPVSIGLAGGGNPQAADFKVFALNDLDFDRGAGTNDNGGTNDSKDFRWAINIKTFHPTAEINGGVQPLITLKTGVLYVPNLSNGTLAPRLVRGEEPHVDLHQIAEDLAVSIVPPAGTQVEFQWQDLGETRSMTLPPTGGDATITYTVAFINEPANMSAEAHDELSLYYRIVDAVPEETRFVLAFNEGAGSDVIPCMPVTKNP